MTSLNAKEKQISTAIHKELDSQGYAFKPQTSDSGTLDNIHSFKREKLLKSSPSLQSDINELDKNGFVILKNLITESECDQLKETSNKLLNRLPSGRNNFEGKSTKRLYGLLGKSRIYDKLILNQRILDICDYYLLPNHLLTAFQAISIGSNEKQQILHYDDQFVNFRRPRPPTSIAFIWAIDDFTKENGATVLIPGSHKWDNKRVPNRAIDKLVPAVMPKGSCVCLLGTLWHGGGKNITNKPRLAISNQHCEPFIRPQENQFLSVPFDTIKKIDPRLQSMCGYSIHYPFIGHSNGMHPLRAIDAKL